MAVANIVQEKLVNSYTVLVIAEEISIEDVPPTVTIGGVQYPIRSEVELEVARRIVGSTTA